jgi:hypothetical protein
VCVNVYFERVPVISDSDHSRWWAGHIRVSLCNAKIDATMRGHLLRGMKLERRTSISNCLGAHVGYVPISMDNKGVVPPFWR